MDHAGAQYDLTHMGTVTLYYSTCKPGIYVSLGSSKCIPCPTYWPRLFVTITMIVFIVSGIGLVASYSILEFNLTVGIRNTIIILSVVASVLISWLNFNLHFNVCSSALCSL